MQTVLNPLVSMYQTQLEASRQFANAVFSGTEKIDQVVIDATRHMFARQLNFAQAMSAVRDPQSAATTVQSNLLTRNPDDAVNYQKEIMRVFAEMQNDIGKSLQQYIEQLGANAATSAAAPLEAAQGHANETVFNPMTSMFSVWESAFKEVAALAKKNMVAARSSMEDAANRALENAGNFTTAAADSMGESASRSTSSSIYPGRSGTTSEEETAASDRRGSPGGGKRKS
jgi:hypothetical protein